MSETPARCAMCSVECPVTVRERASGRRWEPDYPPRDDGLHGLCTRGNLLGELIGLPQRLARAALGKRAERTWCSPAKAIEELAAALKTAAKPVLIVDGRLPWEDLAAVAALATKVKGATLCVFCPPQEAQLVAGLAGAGVTPARPEALAEADGFLLIGDVFAAQPVAAGPVMAAKAGGGRIPIVSIDQEDTITGRFASHALQIAAGTEHVAAAALALAARPGKRSGPAKLLPSTDADALAAACGLEAAQVTAAAEALAGAKKLAVAVAPCPGRTPRWDLVGLAAGHLTGKDGPVAACTSYRANAFLAAAALKARPVEAALDGSHDLLLVIGCDPLSSLPNLAAKAVEAAGTVAALAAAPNQVSDAADILLPMPMVEESDGTLLGWDGASRRVGALAAPPAGTPAVRDVAIAVGDALGASVSPSPAPADAALSAPESLEALAELAGVEAGDGQLLLGMRPDAAAFGDGTMTGLTGWNQAAHPAPVIQLAAEDALRLGLADGDLAEVASASGRCGAAVAVAERQRGGQGSINAAFAASRSLFDFRPVASTVAVTVQKKEV